MINDTQVDERGNKSGSKDGSTICDNYSRGAPCLRTISSTDFGNLPRRSNSMRWKGAIAGGMGTKRVQVVVEERTFSFAIPTMRYDIPNDISVHSRPVKSLAYPVISFRETKVSCGQLDTVPACISMDFCRSSFVVHPQYWIEVSAFLRLLNASTSSGPQ
ncbi:hypothetical protein TNCV_4949701 [Trichonephila clavipes]|nr:hypothetical protein TNCV_4949701 [Trichonephila clavipes]